MRYQLSWWWDVFFVVLQATGNVSKAADAAGRRRRTEVYEIRELNPEFELLWTEAMLAYGLVKEEQQLAEKRKRMEKARFHLSLE